MWEGSIRGKNTEFRVTSMSATYLLLVTLARPGAFVWWLVRTLWSWDRKSTEITERNGGFGIIAPDVFWSLKQNKSWVGKRAEIRAGVPTKHSAPRWISLSNLCQMPPSRPKKCNQRDEQLDWQYWKVVTSGQVNCVGLGIISTISSLSATL